MLLRKSGTSSCFENLLLTLRLMFELIKASVGSRFHELLEKFFEFSSGDDVTADRLESLTEPRFISYCRKSSLDARR